MPLANETEYYYYYDDYGNRTDVVDVTSKVLFWAYGLVLPLIAIPGLFATCVSVIIFTRRIKRANQGAKGRYGPTRGLSLNTLLAGLSLYDFILLLLALLIYPPMAYCEVEIGLACAFFNWTALVTYPLSLIAQFGSVWTCVLIAFDRFVAVQLPLRSLRWCTFKHALQSLVLVTIVGILYRIPSLFELKLNEDGIVVPTEMRLNKLYMEIYTFWLYLAMLFIVPWALMIFMNVVVYRAIQRSYRQRALLASHQPSSRHSRRRGQQTDKERRRTFLAMAVVLTFLLFNLLAFINNWIEKINISPEINSPAYIRQRSLVFLGNLLICVNSATNCIIYCAMIKQFRRMFLAMFCQWYLQRSLSRVGKMARQSTYTL